VRRSC